MLVVDASVAVKWFIEEPQSLEASSLLRSGQRLVAPELIQIEVAAALGKFFRMQILTERQVRILLDTWQKYLVQEVIALQPTPSDFQPAVEYSLNLRHQLQDCLYIATAKRLGMSLVTADEKLLKKREDIDCELQSLQNLNTKLTYH